MRLLHFDGAVGRPGRETGPAFSVSGSAMHPVEWGHSEGTAMLLIPSVQDMDDETLMLHLENRHKEDLRLEFRVEPDRTERRLLDSDVWRTYHDTMHRLYPEKYEHQHKVAA